MPASCQELVRGQAEAWQKAIKHPFLESVSDGTVEELQFNTWLVQDFVFVKQFTRFVALVLAGAPFGDFDLLLEKLAALREELKWFQSKAAERGLGLDVPPADACEEFISLLDGLALEDYAVQSAALWAIEHAYHEGWKQASPVAAPYTEYAERWGNVKYGQSVHTLEQLTDRALAAAAPEVQERAAQVVTAVAEAEQKFWQMALALGSLEA